MDDGRVEELKSFENEINYNFNNLEILDIALTHSSYTNEHNESKTHNERLEFLGDSVVNLIVTDLLFKKLKNLAEGDLTKIRASIICEDSFAKASHHLTIPDYMLLGKGEEQSGGRKRKSLMADSFEAFCGAMYIDSNFETVKNFLYQKFESLVVDFIRKPQTIDYKTILQEEVQKRSNDKLKYKLVKEEGPDHDKFFYFDVFLGQKLIGSGRGKSKKEAEHGAAHDSLKKMGLVND